jgi:hypothetical protein
MRARCAHLTTEESKYRRIGAKLKVRHQPRFRVPELEHGTGLTPGSRGLTSWTIAGLLANMDLGKADGRVIWGTGLVPFPVHEFRGNGTKSAVVETDVSPSDFIFAAKNIVCYLPVPPAVKKEISTTDLRSRKWRT